MTPRSAARSTRLRFAHLPLRNGDRMDRPTFHSLYLTTPEEFKAELIGGTVFVTPPGTTCDHGSLHAHVVGWLGSYIADTPGVQGFDSTTILLSETSEPQPDACVILGPECGGQVALGEDGFVYGPPELIAEVAYSSAAIDLHAKRADYEEAGVREYYVAVVETQKVVRFIRRGSRLIERPADADGVIRSAVFPGLWLDPTGLFADTTRQLTATLRAGIATPEHAAFVAKLEAKRTRRRRS